MNFKPTLAAAADLDRVEYPIAAQLKYDGIRCTIQGGVALSRSLKPIPNVEIQAALGRAEFDGFDGEIIVGLPEAPDAFQRTTSFVRSKTKTGEPWAFMAFDLVIRKGMTPYGERRKYLKARLDRLTWTGLPVFLAEERILRSRSDLYAYEREVLAVGHEGLILRDLAAPYKFGRSGKAGPLLKVKRFIDYEAEVVGVYEEMHNGNEAVTNALGRTERSSTAAGKTGKGRLGGLILRAVNGPHAGQTFRCGTGFTAIEREELWYIWKLEGTSAGRMLGSIAKIKSFPMGVKDAPRFPVFLGWRDMEIDG